MGNWKGYRQNFTSDLEHHTFISQFCSLTFPIFFFKNEEVIWGTFYSNFWLETKHLLWHLFGSRFQSHIFCCICLLESVHIIPLKHSQTHDAEHVLLMVTPIKKFVVFANYSTFVTISPHSNAHSMYKTKTKGNLTFLSLWICTKTC